MPLKWREYIPTLQGWRDAQMVAEHSGKGPDCSDLNFGPDTQ